MKLKYILPVLGSVALISFASPVNAQEDGADLIDEETITEEIGKFTKVAEGLANIVTMFTTILITPMGISAGAKVFKTLVLYNL